MKSILILMTLLPFGVLTQGPGFEFHYSVNHASSLNTPDRTFFGGGIGGNVIFGEKVVGFKTGVEFNFFHVWTPTLYAGHYTNQTNVHYQFVTLSIPAIVRFSFGEEFKFFVESGAYLGIGYGKMKYDYFSWSAYNNPSVKGQESRDYFSGLSLTPTIGLGGRFPLSESVDLMLKPEFAFVMNQENNKGQITRFFYGRFCVGIHLK